ncbi:MAG: hypothetical protein QOK31_833 [Solirubrobacteraceae bacterium]|nr:hypothetical protein [Solirubrobacteraceae bacterium]
MRRLRLASTRRLLALLGAVVLVVAAGSAIAVSAFGGGAQSPPAVPLPQAIRDALTRPPVTGLTARITFSNHLIDAAGLDGGNPILTGATGRLWLSADGRARVELQSRYGDAQLVWDRGRAWLFDGASNTLYRGTFDLRGRRHRAHERGVPSIARIARVLARVARHADVSGALPGVIADRPAYSVRVSPRRDGGLVGGALLAWDAARGVPLRAAIFARGSSTPVLELTATQISYAPVAASVFAPLAPAGAHIVDVRAPAATRGRTLHGAHRRVRPIRGLAAVARGLPFKVSAPATLAGLRRAGVRGLRVRGSAGALVAYGHGLGGIVVLERRASRPPAARPGRHGHRSQLELKHVAVGGVTGQELPTALGTLVRFERAGVSYTVIGSVPPAVAEAAARGL